MTTETQTNILLFGLGAIGSFYAFILNRAENVRLTVVARSNYEAVKANGFTIRSENHGEHEVVPYKVFRTPAEASETFDYVVCAHKAIDQESVPELLAPAIDGDRTTIVIIQNGVGNEEPFRQRFPNTSIISCVCWVGATQTQPGIVSHTKSEETQIGLFPNRLIDNSVEAARLERFVALLRQGGTVVETVPEVQTQRWEKVVWNAAWNGLTTVTMADTHAWLGSSAGATPMTRRLMREVIDVARACGVPLEHALADRLIDRIRAMHPIGSSMQTDARHARPMEVEAILGYPVRKARELGLDVPVVETLYLVLTAMNQRFINNNAAS